MPPALRRQREVSGCIKTGDIAFQCVDLCRGWHAKVAIAVYLFVLLVLPAAVRAQMPMMLDRGDGHLVGQPYTSYIGDQAYFYGDSVTVGYDPFTPNTPVPNRFSTVLSTNLHMVENNYGEGGSEIADGQSDAITQNIWVSNSTVSVWFTGYNDVFWYGDDAAGLADNLATVESMAAWLAIPTSLRVPSSNSSGTYAVSNSVIFYGAGWSYMPRLLGGLEYSISTTPASFYFSGSTLLIGITQVASGGGNATVVVGDVDGSGTLLQPTETNLCSCIRTARNTGPGANPDIGNRTYSAGLVVFTNLSNARHYCFFTPQTTANTFLGWFASYSTNQLPKVFLSGTLKAPGSDYVDYHPGAPGYTNGSAAAADIYTLMLSNAAISLSQLGLNVKWVPAPLLNSNTDYFFDTASSDYIHPDASGHAKIASSIQSGF